MAETGRQSPDGNKSYKSNSAKQQSQVKAENVKSNLQDNKSRSKKAKTYPRNEARINELKSMGQNLISRFFRGFTTEERANVKADLDDFMVYRIIDNYQASIKTFAEYKSYANADQYATDLDVRFFGAISLGLAIKLHNSSTDTEKKANKLLSALECKIKLPKKLGVLLDQVGKSDVTGDNHFRIRNQNFAAKRHLVKAIYNLIPKLELEDWMDDHYGNKWTDLNTIMENPEIFGNMVDNTSWSLDRIKEIGKQIYEQATNDNFEFWEKDKERKDADQIFKLRLPKVNFNKLDLDEVGKIMKNAIFTAFSFDKPKMTEMAAGLVLACAKHRWMKNPGSTMSTLDSKFGGTWFADLTFKQILNMCKVWSVNHYFDDQTLNNLALECVKRWNDSYSQPFSIFLDIAEIPFTEHGSDAQLIQVDQESVSKKKGIMGYSTRHFTKKSKSSSVFKIGENNALLGTMVGYTKNIGFNSDWNVEFNSTNRAMLYEFLKNDFKDTY